MDPGRRDMERVGDQVFLLFVEGADCIELRNVLQDQLMRQIVCAKLRQVGVVAEPDHRDIRKMLPYEGGEKIQMMTDDHIRFQVADRKARLNNASCSPVIERYRLLG